MSNSFITQSPCFSVPDLNPSSVHRDLALFNFELVEDDDDDDDDDDEDEDCVSDPPFNTRITSAEPLSHLYLTPVTTR